MRGCSSTCRSLECYPASRLEICLAGSAVPKFTWKMSMRGNPASQLLITPANKGRWAELMTKTYRQSNTFPLAQRFPLLLPFASVNHLPGKLCDLWFTVWFGANVEQSCHILGSRTQAGKSRNCPIYIIPWIKQSRQNIPVCLPNRRGWFFKNGQNLTFIHSTNMCVSPATCQVPIW